MKNQIFTYVFLFTMIIFLGTACFAPVNSSYESARTLGKGNIEASGMYSHYIAAADGETENSNDNFGLRLGYGIGEKFDASLQYLHLNTALDEEGAFNGNYFSLAFKYGLLQNYIAVSLPISAYLYNSESTFAISPKLLFSYPFNDKFETTFASKIDFYLEEDSDAAVGLNLGFGLSKDLNKWAIRPEAGYIFDPGEEGGYWSFGVGFNYYIQGNKSLGGN